MKTLLTLLPTCLHTWGTASFLLILIIMDVRSRQLPNRAWLLAIPLIILAAMADPLAWLKAAPLWALIIGALTIMLWLGQSIGGADVKGSTVLALVLMPASLGDALPMSPVLPALLVALLQSLLWQRLGTGTPFPLFLALAPWSFIFWWLMHA